MERERARADAGASRQEIVAYNALQDRALAAALAPHHHYLYIDQYVNIHTSIYTHVYEYVYVYVYICMYIYIYTYTHKHTHDLGQVDGNIKGCKSFLEPRSGVSNTLATH